MAADITREPKHHPVHFHKAGRFQSGSLVGPAGVVLQGHEREVMLGIEQVGPARAADEMRNDEGEKKSGPAGENHQ